MNFFQSDFIQDNSSYIRIKICVGKDVTANLVGLNLPFTCTGVVLMAPYSANVSLKPFSEPKNQP